MDIRGRVLLSSVLGCIVWCLAALPAHGQAIDGSIFGVVTDSTGGRLPGVTVTIASPQLIGGEQTRITGPEGTYRFASLPPGTYTVTFALQGFQTLRREEISLLAGQSIAVDGELGLSQVEESITIVGESPVVDTRNSALVNIETAEMLENIPMKREFTSLLNIMPGVTDGRYNFAPVNNIHGSTVRQNVYSLDGINIDDALQNTTSMVLAVDIFQEIQLTTAGISAEYGDASGGVINYVTKSGGNIFSGGANLYYQDENTESDNLSSELKELGLGSGGGVVRNYEYGGILGGPIVKDKAWFFVNARRHEVESKVIDFRGTPKAVEKQLFAKTSFDISQKHRADVGFYIRDLNEFPWSVVASFRNSEDERTWWGIFKRNYLVNPKWTAFLNDETLLDVRGSYMWYQINPFAPFDDPSPAYQDVSTGIQSGGGINGYGDNRRNRHQIKGDLSYFKEDWGGSHNFKTGLHWQTTPVFEESHQACPPPCQSELPDTLHLLFNGDPYRVQLYNTPYRRNFAMDKWAAYVQDQWVIGERITLNLGVRVDSAKGTIEESPQGPGQWQELITFPAQEGIIDITNMAPRFGIVWDVTGDRKTVVKGSAGRFYNQLGVAYLQPPMPVGLGWREYDWSDLNGNFRYDVGEEDLLRADTRVDPDRLPTVDPDLRNQYTDVYTVGFERELGPDWGLTVTGIVKRDRDIMGETDAVIPYSVYEEITVTNPLANEPLNIFTLPEEYQGIRGQTVLTNPEEQNLRRNYTGVEVVVNKRLRDDWQLQTSYVFSDVKGNISNQYGNSDYGKNKNPNRLINRYGPLSMGPDHQFKLHGAWFGPYGLVFSGFFEVLSGLPWRESDFFINGVQGAATVRFFRSDFPQILSEDFIDVAGEAAGTRRFDTQTHLDARVEKRFPVGLGNLIVSADIFNIFNSGTVIRVQDLRLDNPRFGLPAEVQSPRQLRVSMKWNF